VQSAAYIAAGLVAIYLFFTDARFMVGAAIASLVIVVLERLGVTKRGVVYMLARYFLAIAVFVTIPAVLILALSN
jgi:hypothetical protein